MVFFVHGTVFASWTAHIPVVKGRLGLDDGTLGFALLGVPAGSVLAMVAASWLLARYGSRRVVQVSLAGYCAAGPLVGLSTNLGLLFATLLVWGAFQGMLDVAMNTQAITVEQAADRPLMNNLHGVWSTGSFAGAGIGTAAVTAGLELTPQLAVLGSTVLVIAGVLSTALLADSVPAAETVTGQRKARRFSRPMVALGAIAGAAMLCEGAAADWASVYLADSLHTSRSTTGLGYLAFALAMVAVRFGANRLLRRLPAHRLIPALAVLATAGFAAGLLTGVPAVVIAGFGCLGLGLGTVVPTVFSAAGRMPGLPAGTAVATAAAFGWVGFVCGPPVIGHLAALTTRPVALGLLPVLTAFIAVAAARTLAPEPVPARR